MLERAALVAAAPWPRAAGPSPVELEPRLAGRSPGAPFALAAVRLAGPRSRTKRDAPRIAPRGA